MPKHEKCVTLRFEGWEFEAFICEDGRLGITIEHPSGHRSADVFVTKQLEVVGDSPIHEMDIHPLMSRMHSDSGLKLREHLKREPDFLALCENDWRAAQQVIHGFMGYEYVSRHVPHPFYRLNGVVCDPPPQIDHRIAWAIIKDLAQEP